MIQNIQDPLLNGVRTDHSSTILYLDGIPYKFPSINYSDGLEPGEVRGNQTQVMAITRGTYKASGSFELWKAESDVFNANLIQHYPRVGFYEINFPIVLQYKAEAQTGNTTVAMPSVRIKQMDNSSQQGSEAHKVKYDLYVFGILRNGIPPVSDFSLGIGNNGGFNTIGVKI